MRICLMAPVSGVTVMPKEYGWRRTSRRVDGANASPNGPRSYHNSTNWFCG